MSDRVRLENLRGLYLALLTGGKVITQLEYKTNHYCVNVEFPSTAIPVGYSMTHYFLMPEEPDEPTT